MNAPLLGRWHPGRIGVWMSLAQFVYWSRTQLTIDVVPGWGAGFSLEAPTGNRFLIRALFSDEEAEALDAIPDCEERRHGR